MNYSVVVLKGHYRRRSWGKRYPAWINWRIEWSWRLQGGRGRSWWARILNDTLIGGWREWPWILFIIMMELNRVWQRNIVRLNRREGQINFRFLLWTVIRCKYTMYNCTGGGRAKAYFVWYKRWRFPLLFSGRYITSFVLPKDMSLYTKQPETDLTYIIITNIFNYLS